MINYGGKSVKAKVVDECPSEFCSSGQVDASKGVFSNFASLDTGIIQMAWDFVPCDGSITPVAPAPKPAANPKPIVGPKPVTVPASNPKPVTVQKSSTLPKQTTSKPTPQKVYPKHNPPKVRRSPVKLTFGVSKLEALPELSLKEEISAKEACYSVRSSLRHSNSLDEKLDQIEKNNQALNFCDLL